MLQIINEFPELTCTSAVTLPKSSTDIKPIHLFNASVFVSIIVGSILCATMGSVSLLALREMVRECSSSLRTISMHRGFLISLFCQIGVHGVMLGFPLFVYMTSIVFHFDGNGNNYFLIQIKCSDYRCWLRGNRASFSSWSNEHTGDDCVHPTVAQFR